MSLLRAFWKRVLKELQIGQVIDVTTECGKSFKVKARIDNECIEKILRSPTQKLQ